MVPKKTRAFEKSDLNFIVKNVILIFSNPAEFQWSRIIEMLKQFVIVF